VDLQETFETVGRGFFRFGVQTDRADDLTVGGLEEGFVDRGGTARLHKLRERRIVAGGMAVTAVVRTLERDLVPVLAKLVAVLGDAIELPVDDLSQIAQTGVSQFTESGGKIALRNGERIRLVVLDLNLHLFGYRPTFVDETSRAVLEPDQRRVLLDDRFRHDRRSLESGMDLAVETTVESFGLGGLRSRFSSPMVPNVDRIGGHAESFPGRIHGYAHFAVFQELGETRSVLRIEENAAKAGFSPTHFLGDEELSGFKGHVGRTAGLDRGGSSEVADGLNVIADRVQVSGVDKIEKPVYGIE